MEGAKETFLLIISVAVIAIGSACAIWQVWENRRERREPNGMIPGRELYRKIKDKS